jgi:hypothetical protein
MSASRLFPLAVSALLMTPAIAAPLAPIQGSAWIRHTIDHRGQGADGVRLADVNADGQPDIVTPWEEGGRIRVYLNPGPEQVKQTWFAVTVGAVESPEDAVFVDLDGDGATDVVSASEGKTLSLAVHWAPSEPAEYLNPHAWTTEVFPGSTGTAWMYCLPMDVDGQRGIDLIVGSKGGGVEYENAALRFGGSGVLGWFESPEDPRALDRWIFHDLRPTGWTMTLAAVDMNGDQREDLLFTDRKGARRGCWWLEKPGEGQTAWLEQLIGGEEKELMFATVARRVDGLPVAVAAATAGDTVLWFEREARANAPWQSETLTFPPGVGTGKGVAAGDLDGDGREDLVVSCENAKNKTGVLWFGRADGRAWTAHRISDLAGTKFDLVQLHDLDGDGDLDVLTCEEKEGLGVVWYENPGATKAAE